jgi:hypothetical protein
MSGRSILTQTPWEETPEEIEQRLKKSRSNQTSWLGTIVGLLLAALALVVLLRT